MPEPHALLAKALLTLSTEEQGDVLKALLPTPTFGSQPPNWVSESTAAMAGMAMGRKDEVVAAYGVRQLVDRPGPEQSSLLVRLPTALHTELKTWSEENGHSMNTVVRGLLERFLEAQRNPGNGKR